MLRSVPGPPRCARAPQLIEMVAVAKRIHRLPEAFVPVAGELAVAGERAHRLLLPHGVGAPDVAADLGGEHEEAAVHPAAVAARLLFEPAHQPVLDLERAEAPGRLYGGHRRARPLLAVKGDPRGDVDVGDAIAVGEAE